MSVQVRRHPRGTLAVVRAGQRTARVLGPRELLTLDEAAEVLGRPREHVERVIRAGFLRVRRKGTRRYVTVQACRTFLAEERADLDAAHASRGGRFIPAEEVFRQIGD
jgi:excisionase family DNA binding protein